MPPNPYQKKRDNTDDFYLNLVDINMKISLKQYLISPTGSGQQDSWKMPQTCTLQPAVINKDAGHKMEMMTIKLGSVRKRFPAVSDVVK